MSRTILRSLSRSLRIAFDGQTTTRAAALGESGCLWGPLQQFFRGAKKQANELRVGNVVDIKGRLLMITKYHYTQGMSRQLGNVQMELRDIKTNMKASERFRPADGVNLAILEDRKFTCLYTDGNSVHLMDPESYEQIEVDKSLFGEQAVYLREDLELEVAFHQDAPVTATLPTAIKMKVKETDAPAGADSVNSKFKPAVLENGVKTMVPTFIAPGEEIFVNSIENSFMRRANKYKEK
ncbi:hypothetical protein BSKO_05033 [Bryopsis sp. KO-2023]|nr:hypothetical protein BSKO_05033 [Bryopsis sp. KO-2023]